MGEWSLVKHWGFLSFCTSLNAPKHSNCKSMKRLCRTVNKMKRFMKHRWHLKLWTSQVTWLLSLDKALTQRRDTWWFIGLTSFEAPVLFAHLKLFKRCRATKKVDHKHSEGSVCPFFSADVIPSELSPFCPTSWCLGAGRAAKPSLWRPGWLDWGDGVGLPRLWLLLICWAGCGGFSSQYGAPVWECSTPETSGRDGNQLQIWGQSGLLPQMTYQVVHEVSYLESYEWIKIIYPSCFSTNAKGK